MDDLMNTVFTVLLYNLGAIIVAAPIIMAVYTFLMILNDDNEE